MTVVVILAGCKSPRAKHEATAAAVIPRISRFAPLATQAPSSANSTGLASLTAFSAKYRESNAMLVHQEELANPTVRLALRLRLNHRSPTVDVANVLGLTQSAPSLELDDYYDPSCPDESEDWQRLGALKYLVVARTLGYDSAEMVGAKTFANGGWKGDILIFDFANEKLLGGFALQASNHGSVKTSAGRDQANLDADLQLAARGNLNATLRTVIPSVGDGDELN